MINLRTQRAAGVGSVVLVAGVAVNALLNYGFGVTLAWLLPQREFGQVGVLLGVLMITATMLSAGFPWSLARTVAQADGADATTPVGTTTRAGVDAAFRAALLGNVGLGVALAAGLVTAQLVTGRILPGASGWLTATMAATIVALSLYSVLWGALHGAKRFDAITLTQLVEVLVKVVGGLTLVGLVGLGVAGVAGALLLSFLVAIWLAVPAVRDMWPGRGPVAGVRAFASAAPMAIGTIGFGLLTTLDVLVLGAIGGEDGQDLTVVAVYQAAAVLARAPVLLSSALSEATFPFIAKGRTPAEAHRGFLVGFRWVPLVLVPIQLVFLITPASVLGLLFPDDYARAAGLCRLITVGALGLIVVDMLLKALLARGLAAAVGPRITLAVLAQLVGLVVLLPHWGAVGAAIAFGAGTWVGAALLASVYLRQYWPGWLPARTVLRWLGAAGVLAGVLALAPLLPRPLDLLVIAAGLLVYAGLALWLRLLPEELLVEARTRLRGLVRRRSTR